MGQTIMTKVSYLQNTIFYTKIKSNLAPSPDINLHIPFSFFLSFPKYDSLIVRVLLIPHCRNIMVRNDLGKC